MSVVDYEYHSQLYKRFDDLVTNYLSSLGDSDDAKTRFSEAHW